MITKLLRFSKSLYIVSVYLLTESAALGASNQLPSKADYPQGVTINIPQAACLIKELKARITGKGYTVDAVVRKGERSTLRVSFYARGLKMKNGTTLTPAIEFGYIYIDQGGRVVEPH